MTEKTLYFEKLYHFEKHLSTQKLVEIAATKTKPESYKIVAESYVDGNKRLELKYTTKVSAIKDFKNLTVKYIQTHGKPFKKSKF